MKTLGLSFFALCHSLLIAQNHLLIPVSPSGLETNEPSIAIDPKYPSFQVLGSNTSNFFISQDAGLTWLPKLLKPEEGYYGDPVTHIKKNGDIYITHLSKTKGKSWPEHFDRIVFQSSTDGAESFQSSSLGYNQGKMQDKPWLSVDECKRSKFKNRIYITWTEFDKYGSPNTEDSSRIRFAYSADNGKTWSNPKTISDNSGDANDGDNTLEGANIAIGKNGELYCVWAGRNKIWLDISLDGGETWQKDQPIAEQPGGWNIEELSGLNRANNMPFIISPNGKTLHVIYGHNQSGMYNIYSLTSNNNGQTWGSPVQVNQNNIEYPTDQYMPHICFDSRTKKVFAAYYTRRFSPNNIYIDLVITPLNKKKWGKEYRITKQSIPPPGQQVFFGDYISIASVKKNIRLAFTYFDEERNIPSVMVAIAKSKQICNPQPLLYPAHLKTVYRKKQDDVVIHAELPKSTSAVVEVYRGQQIVYKNVYPSLTQPIIEEIIPLEKLGKGLFQIKILAGKNNLQSGFFIQK
jgi:hypothetical protein